MLLWQRTASISVIVFMAAQSVDISSAQTALINGGNQTGIIFTNTTADSYTFTANTGDNLVLRLGTTGFDGNLNLYGPTSALLKTAASGTDAELDYTATNSGTFTVLVSSYYLAGSGTYVLRLAQFPEAFIVPGGDEGGPMTNGGNHPGTNSLGDLDMWSFTASTGDNIVLRLGTTGFDGNLNLYGPNGKLLKTAVSGTDAELDYTATNSGTFTALVSSYYSAGTGTYVLHLAQFPEAFIVPGGDEGGPMTNGGNYSGTNSLGDLDIWSFTANAGNNIVLRLGTTGFNGNLSLYGPTGALLKTVASGTDAELDYTATNNGTFTALVRSYFSAGTGTYVLHLAQFPGAFIVPGGDEGGLMTNGGPFAGTITLADEDLWAFTACTGDSIILRLNSTNFTGNMDLYGPTGALLKTAASATVAGIDYSATNCGTFIVLVTSYFSGGTGTYGLTANGLSYGLRVCPPVIRGQTLTVNGVGGVTNAAFILYTTTNVATSLDLWTPILTNRFDQFGVFTYTNVYNPAQRQQYFRFVEQ